MRVLLTVHQPLPKHSFGTERLTYDVGRKLIGQAGENYGRSPGEAATPTRVSPRLGGRVASSLIAVLSSRSPVR